MDSQRWNALYALESTLEITLNIVIQICLCGDLLTNDAFEKVVAIYRHSVVDENDSGSQTK